ncbi:EF-hand domain-containing protein [Asticcacaulis sp. BYS171W]|uniref:EF-hand domain-containing protein n=1 Tax=Asticcacaulis aquaticus TaxID=2984212 RepID=A0ABT5I0U6_9CAUL|nr:EF-hand domain-containing protein [Asticcacaulis aquaticus]MDC7685311.1 EF-hand domain-containing protein [Asticcacaulis aquaticus]
MKFNTVIRLATFVMAVQTMAFAAEPLSESLAKFDRDHDGRVSLAEWTRDRPAQFKKLDANKDARLTLDEVRAAYLKLATINDPKTKKRIDGVMNADANSDGSVTLDEYVAYGEAGFKRRDTDGDGFLTAADH